MSNICILRDNEFLSHSPQLANSNKYLGPKGMKEKLRDFTNQMEDLYYHLCDFFSLKLFIIIYS